MKNTIKVMAFISLIGGILLADNKGGVIPPQIQGTTRAQDKRIIENFKKIDKLFASIKKRIANIEKTKKDIEIMLKNKDFLVLCQVIKGMDRDINRLEDRIKKLKASKRKSDLETQLIEVRTIRNEEKSKINYTCPSL